MGTGCSPWWTGREVLHGLGALPFQLSKQKQIHMVCKSVCSPVKRALRAAQTSSHPQLCGMGLAQEASLKPA